MGEVCTVANTAGTVFQNEDYGIAFRPGEKRKKVDEALLSIREDGTYDLIKSKWFGECIPPTSRAESSATGSDQNGSAALPRRVAG